MTFLNHPATATTHTYPPIHILRELTQPTRFHKIISLANDPTSADFKTRRKLCQVWCGVVWCCVV